MRHIGCPQCRIDQGRLPGYDDDLCERHDAEQKAKVEEFQRNWYARLAKRGIDTRLGLRQLADGSVVDVQTPGEAYMWDRVDSVHAGDPVGHPTVFHGKDCSGGRQ